MAKINVVNLQGEKVKDITLNDSIWNIEVNEIILKNAINLALASLRQGTHKTKTRAEVSGTGKKPWKQKGTGRARQGSRCSPNFVGGGVVFGVSPRNYGYKMNKQERVIAIKSALSTKLQNKELVVIDEVKLPDLKTKGILAILKNLKSGKKVLFVTKNENENLYMATRNLKTIGQLMATDINVLDIVNANTLVMDLEAIKYIEEVLS